MNTKYLGRFTTSILLSFVLAATPCFALSADTIEPEKTSENQSDQWSLASFKWWIGLGLSAAAATVYMIQRKPKRRPGATTPAQGPTPLDKPHAPAPIGGDPDAANAPDAASSEVKIDIIPPALAAASALPPTPAPTSQLIRARAQALGPVIAASVDVTNPLIDLNALRRDIAVRIPLVAADFFERLERPLTDDDIAHFYTNPERLAILRGAPALLLPQHHNLREVVIQNYVLTFQLLMPDTLVLIEAFGPNETNSLLPLVLGQIAFVAYLGDHPELEFFSPHSLQVRAMFVGAAAQLIRALEHTGVTVPFRDVIARGWDIPNAPQPERNRHLLATILARRAENRRVIVHLGGAHAPSFVRSLAQMQHSERQNPLDLLSTAEIAGLGPAFVEQHPALAEMFSVVELLRGLPPGYIDMLPRFIDARLNPNFHGEPNACARCHKPGDKTCGRCQRTKYCSADCQTKEWPTHKFNCKPPH